MGTAGGIEARAGRTTTVSVSCGCAPPGEVAPVAEELDRTKSFPYELVAKMGELGWMGIPFPEEYGGSGGSSLQYAIAVEELTRVDSRSSTPTMEAPTMACSPSRTINSSGTASTATL